MSEVADPVTLGVEAALTATRRATRDRPIITLIALAHAYQAWRERCRHNDAGELEPAQEKLVAQVDALFDGLRVQYAEAGEASRVDGAIAREVDEVTVITRVFKPMSAKGAA